MAQILLLSIHVATYVTGRVKWFCVPISSSGVGWLRNSTRQSDRHIVYWIAQLTLTGQTVSPLETPWPCASAVRTSFSDVTRYWFKHRNIVISVKQRINVRPIKNDSSFILFGWATWQLYRALCFLSMTTDGDQSSHLGEARALAPVSQMASNHSRQRLQLASPCGTPW